MASEQAMEWFVLLQDDPDDLELRRRFEIWIAESRSHAAAWEKTAWTSSLAESLLPFDAREWVVDGSVPDKNRLRGQAPPPVAGHNRTVAAMTSPPSHRRWLWSAGASAVACLLLFLAWPAVRIHLQADHLTGIAESRDVVLDDGTTVSLAPGSAVVVEFVRMKRGVTLLAGEAFFAVKPDASRPFVVAAGGVRATVVGTAFDVRIGPRTVEVAVNEGRVRVESAGATELLVAGSAVRVSSDGILRTSVAADSVASWRRGVLALEDRTLADAAAELERHLPGRIVIADRALADRKMTGVFDLKNPERAIEGMAAVLGAKVQRITPWIFVVSAQH